MLEWMYNFQDSTSGMWGPRNRKTGELVKYDMNNTASIVKAYRDNNGKNVYADFPLQYSDKLLASSLTILSEPYPGDVNELDVIHEWNLKKIKGFTMVLRYLWTEASEQDKTAVESLLEEFITNSFDKYYVRSEGAFSYYPNARHASADGFSNIIFDEIGAFSYQKQKTLFGVTEESIQNLGGVSTQRLKSFFQTMAVGDMKINSIRFYMSQPDIKELTRNVWAVYYPGDSSVLDVTELVPDLLAWIDSSSVVMGNWTSLAEKKRELEILHIDKPIKLNDHYFENMFDKGDSLYCVGFNMLQVPKCIVKCPDITAPKI